MNKKQVTTLIAFLVAIIFVVFAIQPGVFNMIGYSISILIFPENSTESIKYSKSIIYAFDILCGVLVYFIAYGIIKRIQKI
jgi:phage shock protein PspC (stress-responsive transcriptional regulator)